MRLECPSCHQVVSPALAINAGDVGMTCPSCGTGIPATAIAGAETDDELASTTPIPRVKELADAATAAVEAKQAETRPAVVTAAAPEVDRCPKCEAALRPGLAACATCGLATSRMPTFTSERDTSVPEAIRAAWDQVVERWTDEARHDALFRLVAERGEYGWVAARYREQARERDNDAIATKQMERIRRAIEATLLVSATARDKPATTPYKNLLALLVVLIIVLVVGMVYVFVKARSAPDAPPEAVPMSPRPQVR
ncbi:MAG: hypothetical protein IPQ07_21585 [Myxococcales bacterium]|nr:hypothetical protein [Myxococcales bacterium]